AATEGETAGRFPACLPVFANAACASALRGLSAAGLADRQRRHGGRLQDGVHAAPEAVGDAVEEGRRPDDPAIACDPAEWYLGRGVCTDAPGTQCHPRANSRSAAGFRSAPSRVIGAWERPHSWTTVYPGEIVFFVYGPGKHPDDDKIRM